MRPAGVVLVLLAAYPSTGAAQDGRAQKELAKLQGVWKVEAAVAGGERIPAGQQARMGFTFRGAELLPADNPRDVATVTLDPGQTPAAIDLTERNGRTSPGIYAIDGDTLKLCLDEPGRPRPKTFASAKGSQTFYVVLRREKK